MGLLGKIFKPIKKVFKGIGKLIKKAFKGFGKFMNKLGIFGQIGMMFIMPGIANVALKGLTQLGSGFMAGLGKVAAGQSALSGVAKVSHALLSTAANTAKAGISGFRTITDTVVGTVTDTARAIGSKMGGGAFKAPLINPTTGQVSISNQAGGILENAANRLQAGAKRTWGNLSDAARAAGDVMPGGPEYAPDVQKYKLQEDGGLFGGRKGDIVERDTKYSTKNANDFEKFQAAVEEGTDKLPSIVEKKDFISQSIVEPFAEGRPSTHSVASQYGVAEVTKLTQREAASEKDFRLGLFDRGSTDKIAMETDVRGSGTPLTETGFDARYLGHADYVDWNSFSNNKQFYDSYLGDESYTGNEWSRVIRQSASGKPPSFRGSFVYG